MNHLKQTVLDHVKVKSMPNDYNPFEGRGGENPDVKVLKKEKDPALQKIIENQERVERALSTIVPLRDAKQRDSGDNEFNYQGPQHFRGRGHRGTKDRMPGTTPHIVEMNPLEAVLDALGIQKFQPPPPTLIKPKNTGDYI